MLRASLSAVCRSPRCLLVSAFSLMLFFIVYVVFFSPALHDRHKSENHRSGEAGRSVVEMLRQENIIRVRREKDSSSISIEEAPSIRIATVGISNSSHDDRSNEKKNEPPYESNLEKPQLPGAVRPSGDTNGSSDNDFGHPILLLSRRELAATPISEMMGWYGEALGGGSCSDDFGNSLVRRWRNKKCSYCSSTNGAAPRVSQIDCFLVRQTRHHGDGDQLCRMYNVSLDIGGVFGHAGITSQVVKRYVQTRHMQQPYVQFPRGFLKADCEPDAQQWVAKHMPGWNADLTVNTLRSINTLEMQRQCDFDGTSRSGGSRTPLVAHKVLIQQRDTFANFFHDSEDFFNVFLAMAILEWKPGETQVLLTDLYPRGPFWDMWSRVFSHGQASLRALTAWDLKQQYTGSVCFSDVAIGIYGPAAPMTVASWNTPCRKTALVRAYSDFVLRSMELQQHTHYAQLMPSSEIVITYMARRPSAQWPERKYCDSENSFFLCSLWDSFGQRKLGRMIRNDAEVVAALKELEKRDFSDKNVKRVVVNNVDYNVLSFEEQLRVDLQTDIMIGPHGAGLMHSVFMRERAMLLELFVDGSSVNRHFHNMAHWYGRPYRGVSINNPIAIPALMTIVEQAIDTVAENIDKY